MQILPYIRNSFNKENNMRKLCFVFALLLLFSFLCAEQVGSIRFVLGDVQYKEQPGSAFQKAKIDSPVSLSGEIFTGKGAAVEIMWKDGNVSKVDAEQSVSIRKLHEELSQEGWADKLKRKLSAIITEKKPKESSVAGIRRDEVSINKASELYWSSEDSAEFDKAYKLFEEDKLDEAIELLEKVIEQDPLKDQADMSHALLILIYEQQGNSEKMQEHLEIWKKDFPNSKLRPEDFMEK